MYCVFQHIIAHLKAAVNCAVAPEELLEARRRRPDLPCFLLSAAVRRGLGGGGDSHADNVGIGTVTAAAPGAGGAGGSGLAATHAARRQPPAPAAPADQAWRPMTFIDRWPERGAVPRHE